MGEPMPNIEHVIVLALENRSFDHLLGYLDHPDPSFDGLRGAGVYTNPGLKPGEVISPSPSAKTVLPVDPDHSHDSVMAQLGITGRSARSPTNQGFVASYERKGRGRANNSHSGPLGRLVDLFHRLTHPGAAVKGRGPLIMSCHDPTTVPVVSTLAKEFGVCTRWFSSVPGETWPNRNFLHSATSAGEDDIQPGFYTDTTIFEVLEQADRSWHIYHDDTPQVWAFVNLWDTPARHVNWFPFSAFTEHAASGKLPNYSFIEPNQRPPIHVMDDRATGPNASNSQHPGNNLVADQEYDGTPPDQPGDFRRAESLIATIYEALRANPAVFERSILLITYDEHGGTYDHVPPPTNVPAPKVRRKLLNRIVHRIYHPTSRPFDFRMLGVRVPAVVVSPLIARGTISTEVRDHASVPSTLRAIFAPSARPLTARDGWAKPFHTLATLPQARVDLPDLSAHVPAKPASVLPDQVQRQKKPGYYGMFVKLAKKVERRLGRNGRTPRSIIVRLLPSLSRAARVSTAFIAVAQSERARGTNALSRYVGPRPDQKGTQMPLLNPPADPNNPDPSTPITGPTLNITRVTGIGATITALGAAATGLFGISNSDPPAVVIAKTACLAAVVIAGLVVAVLVFVADIKARTQAAISAPTPAASAKPASPAAGLWVQVQGEGQQPFIVIDGLPNLDGPDLYLVARADEKPKWIPDIQIESWQTNPAAASDSN
jgi:phospholipase C